MSFPNSILVAGSLALALGAMSPDAAAADRKVPKDFPTIQEAIEAAGLGDRVIVSKDKAGPYAENVVVTKSDIIIQGKNAEVNAGANGVAFEITGDNVIVTGFKIRNSTGAGIRATGNGIEVSRCTIEGGQGNGIEITGDEATIERNTIRYMGGSGIVYAASTSEGVTVIESNKISLNADSGIVSSGAAVEISRNTLEYNQDDGLLINDGGYDGSESTDVDRNKIRCNGGNGICVQETGADGIIIEGNTLENNGRDGIEIAMGSGISIVNNKIKRNSENGIFVGSEGGNLIKNRCENNTLAGIVINNGTGLGSHSIDSNTAKGNGRDGIQITGSGNTLTKNKCDSNLGDGIDIVAQIAGDSTGNKLLGNNCNKNQHEGIDNSGSQTQINDNKASKNGPGGKGLDIAGSGNRADPKDEVGIGTVAAGQYNNNKTGDDRDSDEDSTLPQELDI
ncbi:MAG: hypothetical protein DRQ55_02900 [Planctomycetota bacterium]|nr:MAG: hypothetical protein DRQ55_02900 [Planctomycetota bacterium]